MEGVDFRTQPGEGGLVDVEFPSRLPCSYTWSRALNKRHDVHDRVERFQWVGLDSVRWVALGNVLLGGFLVNATYSERANESISSHYITRSRVNLQIYVYLNRDREE